MKYPDKRLDNPTFRNAVKTCLTAINKPTTAGAFLQYERDHSGIKIDWITWARTITNPTVMCYKTDRRGRKIVWPENNQPILVEITWKRLLLSGSFEPIDPETKKAKKNIQNHLTNKTKKGRI